MNVHRLNEVSLPLAQVIERQSFSDPWDQPLWQRYLPNSFGVFVQQQLWGYAQCAVILDEAELLRIAIDPQQRSLGAGRFLLDAVCDALCAQGVSRVLLEVNVTNQDAIALYQRSSFVLDGRRKGYYPVVNSDQYDDALLMSKTLKQQSEKSL